MQGPLAQGVLPHLLRDIYVGRRNGWLHLERSGERQSLRFRRGHIVNARTNVQQERLGEVMVRHGLLSQADLDRATELVIREKKRLGEVLVALGLADDSRLEDAVALHVHEMLAKVFAWTEGGFGFEEEPEEAHSGDLTLKLSTGDLILEAVRAVADPQAVHSALGDLERVPVPATDPLLRFQKLTLSPADGFVLSRVDGTTSAREIVQMIPLPAEDVERSLFALLSTGLVEYTPARRGRAQPRGAAAPPGPAPAPPPPAAPAPAPVTTAAPAPPPPARPSPPSPAPPSAAAPSPPSPSSPPSPAPPSPAPPSPDRVHEQRREIEDAWEGLNSRNHFEVLGLARGAGEAEVKEAYFRLAKRFHPDVHHGSSLSDLHDKLEAVFIRLGQAYDVLRDARRRADYEERLGRPRSGAFVPRPQPAAPGGAAPAPEAASAPPAADAGRAAPAPAAAEAAGSSSEDEALAAEDTIRRAQRLYERAERKAEAGQRAEGVEYWDAIQLLEPVVHKARGRLRAKGEILLARCYLKNPKWARRAEETLIAVTQREPSIAESWLLLGGIYARKSMLNRALSMYRKAVELGSENEEAVRYLAEHAAPEEPTAEKSDGLLKRLFRKP